MATTLKTKGATVPMGAAVQPGPSSLPVAQMPPPKTNAGGHRGLYITLGAMIVLVVIVAAGFSAPRWFKTRANAGGDSQTNGVARVRPATPTVAETPSAPKAAGTKRALSQPAGDQTPEIHAAKEPARPDPAQLAELDHEMDQISSREAAANASLDSFQGAQSAQGLQLRGDIVAAQQRMQAYAAKAHSALQAQDVENTRKFLDLMETELGKIEKFLGH